MNKKKVIITALIIILIVGGIIFKVVVKHNNGEENVGAENVNTNTQEFPNYGDEIGSFKKIKLNETYTTNQVVKNLEQVTWNMANIEQNNGKMTITVYLSNTSETENILSRDLMLRVKDEKGKEKYYQSVHMDEIEANYGFTSVTAEFNIAEPEIIKDIELSAE